MCIRDSPDNPSVSEQQFPYCHVLQQDRALLASGMGIGLRQPVRIKVAVIRSEQRDAHRIGMQPRHQRGQFAGWEPLQGLSLIHI